MAQPRLESHPAENQNAQSFTLQTAERRRGVRCSCLWPIGQSAGQTADATYMSNSRNVTLCALSNMESSKIERVCVCVSQTFRV